MNNIQFVPLIPDTLITVCTSLLELYSLGQGDIWQISVCRPPPWQSMPPICGVGELQRRIRVMSPSPQVTEHDDQGDQWLQPPSCLTVSNADTINSSRSPTENTHHNGCAKEG